ncbi:MAG: BBE domain-containing protein [Actinomycetota bacterium]
MLPCGRRLRPVSCCKSSAVSRERVPRLTYAVGWPIGASIRTSPTRSWTTGPRRTTPANYLRLAAAKKAYDPDRLFEFPQSI